MVMGQPVGMTRPEPCLRRGRRTPRGRSEAVTSQVSSPAEQADAALVGEQRASGNGGQGKEERRPGDSGDGMRLTGDRFTSETASFGNALSTLPNFPAEIRAPAGTLPGVSS